ncbi:MAG: RluA family pseudouridine synthase [Thermodesulfobacteriota bacterium]
MSPPPPLEIIYQDTDVAVINKPGGLLSVPGRGPDKQECVVNRLKEMIPGLIEQPAVHRLDMATSGLMVLGLNKESHRELSGQFASRQVEKKYIALVDGIPEARAGTICLAFRLDPANRPHQIFDPRHGKMAISHWRLVAGGDSGSRIEFTPFTGRTHQLRLHAAHQLGLACPIIGDPLYGKGKEGERLMLHSTELSFHHPLSGRRLKLHSPPPF